MCAVTLLIATTFISGPTEIIYGGDVRIEADSINKRTISVGDSTQFYDIETFSKNLALNTSDSVGSTSLSATSQDGVTQTQLTTKNKTGDVSSYTWNFLSGPTTAVAEIAAKTSPSIGASINLSSTNGLIPANLSKIIISSAVQPSGAFKGVKFTMAGGSTSGRCIFLDAPLTNPTRGIEYAGTGYVTQTHSLTDKEYVDKNLLLQYTKTTLPSASEAGKMILVTDGSPTNGACVAYSFSNHWVRVMDNVNL